MNIRAYTSTGAIIVAAWLAVAPHLSAQTTFTIPFKAAQTSPATTFTIDSFGSFFETAPISTSATFTFASTPQMVWLPALGAFRAGSFSGSQTTVGQYSVAFGSSTATGAYSFAAGSGNTASGSDSAALNFANIASGSYAFSAGFLSVASGTESTAIGFFAVASGNEAMATGFGTKATGTNSVAENYNTTSAGSFSTAAGYYTTANSYASFVTGQYNTGLSSAGATPNLIAWVATDPLLEVGNGTSTSATSDALVVYKNGNASFPAVTSTVTASAFVTTTASGDIPMYNGTN